MKCSSSAIALLFAGLGLSSIAYADIPAGYRGTPYDPAVAGGPATPPSVKAGPYPIPGRLEFENYDMGGPNVGYFTTDHISCGAAGYRKDGVIPSLCASSAMPDTKYSAPNGDVWFSTGDTTLDGTTYPNATAPAIYIGAVRPGDWVNITVRVQTGGTYQLGSTWASGNGPLGKEGGNGAMELKVSVNGTMMLDWKAVFPNYGATANFHNWKPYPNMGTVALQPGIQVIKLDTGADPHLNLDYVQFSLMTADGGVDPGNAEAGTPSPTGSDAASSSGSPQGFEASTATIVSDGAASGSGTTSGGTAASGGGTAGGGGITDGGGPNAGSPAGCACLIGGTSTRGGPTSPNALALGAASAFIAARRRRPLAPR